MFVIHDSIKRLSTISFSVAFRAKQEDIEGEGECEDATACMCGGKSPLSNHRMAHYVNCEQWVFSRSQ
jgi:hypothetical protein